MINVTNRPYVAVRLITIKFLFRHLPSSLRILCRSVASYVSTTKTLERETGIEPATNSLEGCDSTTELLPPVSALSIQPSAFSPFEFRRSTNSAISNTAK